MKDYFIRLINYDHYANQIILKLIRDANSPEKPVQLMGHLLAAQQRWLNRCLYTHVIDNILWPEKETIPLEQLIDNGHNGWIDYLNTLTPADFDKKICYKTTQGIEFNDSLTDILAHLINHGTHHRAQIGQLLKFAGTESLPPLDYIAYVRS
ncbi:MAG: hypothetical protein JWQ79_3870 [Mucilaginibacter sp.]|jgi:uncharacterized damage-inducible protein DinB|nr:hypothetical protein [Mucilaginibacter sp.]